MADQLKGLFSIRQDDYVLSSQPLSHAATPHTLSGQLFNSREFNPRDVSMSGYPREFTPQREYVTQLPQQSHATFPARTVVPNTADAVSSYFQQQQQMPQKYGEDELVYKVQYKTGAKFHFCSPFFGNTTPKEGDFVIVEADRGVDLGMVMGGTPLEQHYRQLHSTTVGEPTVIEAGKIMRLATNREAQLIPQKGRDEDEVYLVSQYLLCNSYTILSN